MWQTWRGSKSTREIASESRVSDSVKSLLDELRQAGQFDSAGSFSIDADHAREKLQRFQLVKPHLYVLFFLSAAVLSRARTFFARDDHGFFVIEFDGDPFGQRELEDAVAALFSDVHSLAEKRLSELSLGINGGMVFNHDVVVESWSSSAAWRLKLTDQERIVESVALDDVRRQHAPTIGTRIRINEGGVWQSVKRLLGTEQAPPEYEALETYALYAPLDVYTGQSADKSLSKNIDALSYKGALLLEPEQRSEHPGMKLRLLKTTTLPTQTVDVPMRGLLVLGGNIKAGLNLVSNGVTYRKKLPRLMLVRAIVACPTLHRDASASDIVEDDLYHTVVDAVLRAAERLLVDFAGRLPLPDFGTRDSAALLTEALSLQGASFTDQQRTVMRVKLLELRARMVDLHSEDLIAALTAVRSAASALRGVQADSLNAAEVTRHLLRAGLVRDQPYSMSAAATIWQLLSDLHAWWGEAVLPLALRAATFEMRALLAGCRQQFDEAIPMAQMATSIQEQAAPAPPAYADSLLLLATLLRAAGRWQEALDPYERASKLSGRGAKQAVWRDLLSGDVALLRKDWDGAVREYEALFLRTHRIDAGLALSAALQLARRPSEAARAMRRAIHYCHGPQELMLDRYMRDLCRRYGMGWELFIYVTFTMITGGFDEPRTGLIFADAVPATLGDRAALAMTYSGSALLREAEQRLGLDDPLTERIEQDVTYNLRVKGDVSGADVIRARATLVPMLLHWSERLERLTRENK
jgi:tetratricopeptide (TPR) repeat protein